MTDLDKLARGLTEAQMRLIQRLASHGRHVGNSGQAALSLCFYGVAERMSPKVAVYRLTPLGLALKQHIERTPHAD